MKKRILSALTRSVIMALVCAFFWVWIFTFVRDPSEEKRLAIYVDSSACESDALAEELDAVMPESIRFVQVRIFDYALFDTSVIDNADILILKESDIAERADELLASEKLGELFPDASYYELNGMPAGLLLCGADGTRSPFDTVFSREEGEAYYLFFISTSTHAEPLTGTGDAAAVTAAELLLQKQ